MLSNQHFLPNRKCAIIAAHNRQLQKRILFVRRRWFWRGCCCWFSQLVFLCLSYILTLFSQFRCLLLAATQECVSNNGKVTTHRLPTAKIESHQKKNCQAGLTYANSKEIFFYIYNTFNGRGRWIQPYSFPLFASFLEVMEASFW